MSDTTFDKLNAELLTIAKRDYPKNTKSFMKKAGRKLQKKTVARAKLETKKKTGNYIKGFKTGRPYKYGGTEDSVRVYNGSPHAHLIEYGHKQTDKAGSDYGYTPGKHILENSGKAYENEFAEDIEKFIDELLDEHGLS